MFLAVHTGKNGTASASLRLLLPLSLVVPGLLFAAVAWWSHGRTFAEAERDLIRTSEVAREHASKVFDTHRLIADRISHLFAGLDDEAVARAEPALHAAIRGAMAGLPQVQTAIVTNAAGRAVASATRLPVPPGLDLSDRDYFKALRQGEAPIHVSHILAERLTGRAFFGLGRRREGPQAGDPAATAPVFHGVVNVAVTPGYFTAFYETLKGGAEDGAGKVIALVREDGEILVRNPPLAAPAPLVPPGSAFLSALERAPGAGTFVSRSVVESGHPEQIFAYSRVPGVPVLVVAARSTQAILADWRREMAPYLLVVVPTTLALFLLTLTAARRALREEEALEQARTEMARREAAEEDLRRTQRLEAVGQLTSGIAHDVNNLLTVITGNLHFLSRAGMDEARRRRHVINIQAAAERGAKLTGQLLAFARQQRLVPQPVDLNAVVTRLGAVMATTMGGMIRLDTALAASLWPARVDPAQLELALVNLVINARDAMPAGGTVVIGTANLSLEAPILPAGPPAGDYVVLSVTDTGTGMAPGVVARAFEPFFTTKGPGRGSGLGLSQVHGFAHQSGGGVLIRSRPGEGTEVRVFLPRASEAAPVAPPNTEREAGSPQGQATVLVVDDDEAVRAVTAQMLREMGYRVIEAESGAAALRVLARAGMANEGAAGEGLAPGEEVRMAVLDYAMPGMNGLELCWRLRLRRPGLPVLFLTGYADMASLVDEPASDVLAKPFRMADLAARMEALLRPGPVGTEEALAARS